MQLINHTRASLIDYTCTQVAHFFPDGRNVLRPRVEAYMDEALDRVLRCVNAIRLWPQDTFNYLHSSQYCVYLYFLSNTIWRHTQDVEAATKLFLLNKALHGIDCFYEIELPDIFCMGHTTGIVLNSKATYGNYLVLHQNVTVGTNFGQCPVFEEGVILSPGSAVIGKCHIRAHTVVSTGVTIVNQDTPGNTLVFGDGKQLIFKPNKRNNLSEIFRL